VPRFAEVLMQLIPFKNSTPDKKKRELLLLPAPEPVLDVVAVLYYHCGLVQSGASTIGR
jgi:hypothetical protein